MSIWESAHEEATQEEIVTASVFVCRWWTPENVFAVGVAVLFSFWGLAMLAIIARLGLAFASQVT